VNCADLGEIKELAREKEGEGASERAGEDQADVSQLMIVQAR
jgi:hypothetical protein